MRDTSQVCDICTVRSRATRFDMVDSFRDTRTYRMHNVDSWVSIRVLLTVETSLIVSSHTHPRSRPVPLWVMVNGCIIRPFLMLSLGRQTAESTFVEGWLDENYDDEALPRFTRILNSKLYAVTVGVCLRVAARPITPAWISLTTWRVIIGKCCHAEY